MAEKIPLSKYKIWNVIFDAFGNVLESIEDVHNRITYTAQQFDGVTQQYYLRARFYDNIPGKYKEYFNAKLEYARKFRSMK